ncbi:hypothetical protein [Leptospira alstonii]|uniref:Uncharacterized protein n=2 Tax=Leptospira alstonii TaxID=28452 RepID=M6CF58_9LEPT|nr:hypothetical protein [Leptospira alstonii]EMJ90487.1 hypothetical protein LEP1GSC194_1163 [Leptospira alstonii serovar Sichuan str. 79601]EQA80487.1 hypothetical protein LEP1GSC193_4067 [Leptospira alstonii serovar Pingchang str. 80-412]
MNPGLVKNFDLSPALFLCEVSILLQTDETFLIDINSQVDFKINAKEKAFHFRLLAIFHRAKNPVSNTNIGFIGTSYE